MHIHLNERDKDRLSAIAHHRGMSSEDCAEGLIQQSMRKWEKDIRVAASLKRTTP